MKNLIKIAAIAAASVGILACNKLNEPKVETQLPETTATKSYGYKTPIMACYVETNDVNPLNAVDYILGDGTTLFDIVELFASNIHKETVNGEVRPVLYLNDKLSNVLENGGVDTYVRPLQGMGIKVLLTVLGDWQQIGVANMTNTQADQFATILAYTVEKYGLDGIGFDDEYADYPWFGQGTVNSTSYSRIITKLHELMPSDKLITVFDWGNTHTISSSAAAYIDYAYHGSFGSYVTSSNISGMNAPRWSPVSFNLGNNNSVSTAQNYAERAKNEGYGAMMCFNLRTRNDNDPLPMLDAMAKAACGGLGVICTDGNRTRDAQIDPDGFSITYGMAIGQ